MLSAPEQLNRVSMALRGIRPSVEELEMVTEDPAAIDTLVDQYLNTPEFGETIRDMHAESLQLRWDGLFVPAIGGLEGMGLAEINVSMMEEPLKLIEHIVLTNQPYTEIVKSDSVFADGTVAEIWGLPYQGDGTEWVETTYVDPRPKAGILSSNALFARHASCGTNYNRGRANLISSALLCHDIMTRDVTIVESIDISDPAMIANALTEDPRCTACHTTLDGLGSFFYGYERVLTFDAIKEFPVSFYDGTKSRDWMASTGREPSYFGQTQAVDLDLEDLGEAIASDPRFATCTAQRFYAYMHQVDLEEVPVEETARLSQAFVNSGYDARSLLRTIVLDETFLTEHDSTSDRTFTKRTRIEQLQRLVFDLTGYEWWVQSSNAFGDYSIGDVQMTSNDGMGVRLMWGGTDSYYITEPTHTTTPPATLILGRIAADAAAFVVQEDFEKSADDRHLLTKVTPETVGEWAIRTQLVDLHARILAESVTTTSIEIDESYLLFHTVLTESEDPVTAWIVTLSALLQDTRIAHY